MTSLATAIEGMAHWDWCPICRGGLDTGLECAECGADLMPIQKALSQRPAWPISGSVLSRIRARADRCRLGYGGKAWVTSDPKTEVVEDRMWLLEFIDSQFRAMNLLRESLQNAADSFRNLGCSVDADDCEEAIKESLSGGNPGEPAACRTAQERGIAAATGAGQHPADNPESTGDSAERRSPVGTPGTPTPDESNRPCVMVCGVDCRPGDANCNNYCNMAPQKGSMADMPQRFNGIVTMSEQKGAPINRGNSTMKERMVGIGPATVPTVPLGDFTRAKLSRDDSIALWRIIGPTVQRNLTLPLWEQFIAIYIQGCENGIAAIRDEVTP